ncbi:MAG: hypothetical protein Q7S65_03495 [Nanoarchaeota archaeon]|nr:hypothetical protein [Nanoarchaeota archaeon]
MNRKVYVFGNEHLEEDSLAKKTAVLLKPLTGEVVFCRSADELLDAESPLVILDVVKGLKEVRLIPPKKIKSRSLVSLHDFDVGYVLKLMAEMGQEKDIKIIGIPEEGEPQKIAKEVEACLKNLA